MAQDASGLVCAPSTGVAWLRCGVSERLDQSEADCESRGIGGTPRGALGCCRLDAILERTLLRDLGA